MIDYNDIKQTIAENLPDNNRREITAARLRDTLNGFVDKVQETEAGLEGKVSSNETNIGNLSGRMDTNETNVTNLTGRVDSLSGEVSGLSGTVGNLSGEVSGLSGRVDDLSGSIGNVPRIVDNPIKGGANDVASMKWDTTIAAIAGLYTAESWDGNSIRVNKVSVIDGGYVKFDGTIVQLGGYSYFEYTLLKKNGYITIQAPAYGAIIASDDGAIGFAFYDKNGNVIQSLYEPIEWQFSGQLELKVPYGATMIRASLINGAFDPDNLYVIESSQPNNCNQLYNLRRKFNEYTPTVDYLAKIGVDGKPVIDGSNWLSVIKLLTGDELEAEIGYGEGVQLAIGDSNNIEGAKTVVYQEKPSANGLIYYKADKDCYAFVSEPSSFKVTRGDRFMGDMQYEMAALMNKIRPVLGQMWNNSGGKGIFQPGSYSVGNGIFAVFKVPILAGTTLNYVISGGDYTASYGGANYWYSGQPTPTASVETNIAFYASEKKITINNTASNKSGYALLSFVIEGVASGDELLNLVYLSKNA